MASYRILIKKSAQKEIRQLDNKPLRAKIIFIIDSLANDPLPLDTKKIKGLKDSYRIRQGDYRIIYRILKDELVINVVKVQHRREVYRDI